MKLVMTAAVLAVGLVLVFGGYLTFLGVRNVVRGAESRRWPTVQGTVVAADTRRETATDRKSGIEHVTYSTDTVVRYRVGSQDYTTNQIYFGATLGSSDPSAAELQRMRYPAGAVLPVSYDPAQPWLAALKPGVHSDAFWLPVAGLAFLLPGIMAAMILPEWFGRYGSGNRNMPSAAVASVLAFIFSTLGLLALGAGLGRIWNGHASDRWPTTLGEVVFARVESAETQDADTGARNSTFSPTFVYRYEVAGVQHFNNLRRFGRVEGQGSDWAAEIAARYPLGTRLQVA